MKELTNREEVIEQIAKMLINIDEECRNYYTDIYLYIDDDGTGHIAEHQSVDGRSYIDDDHIFVCQEAPCYDTIEERYGCSVEDYIDGRDDAAFYQQAEEILDRAEEKL